MTKIMLVEDDKSLREIYGVRLIAEGYEIISAGDGEEALAMAVKEHPDLVISDVMMPKISGFDMLDILRSTPETKDMKIIMMTALSSEDQRSRGETLGANRYLVKSQVGIEDVVRTVHEVLEDSAMSGSNQSQDFGAPAASSVTETQQPTIEPNTDPQPEVSVTDQPVETPEVAPETNSAEVQPEVAEPKPQEAPLNNEQPDIVAEQTQPEPVVVTEKQFDQLEQQPVEEVEQQEIEQVSEQIPVQPEIQEPAAPVVDEEPSQTLEPAFITPAEPNDSSDQPLNTQISDQEQLPVPTAPFSTPAPASLGTEITTAAIKEAEAVDSPDMRTATQVVQELDGNNTTQTPGPVQ